MILIFSFSQPQNTLLSTPHSAQCVHSNLASINLHPDVFLHAKKLKKYDLKSLMYNRDMFSDNETPFF